VLGIHGSCRWGREDRRRTGDNSHLAGWPVKARKLATCGDAREATSRATNETRWEDCKWSKLPPIQTQVSGRRPGVHPLRESDEPGDEQASDEKSHVAPESMLAFEPDVGTRLGEYAHFWLAIGTLLGLVIHPRRRRRAALAAGHMVCEFLILARRSLRSRKAPAPSSDLTSALPRHSLPHVASNPGGQTRALVVGKIKWRRGVPLQLGGTSGTWVRRFRASTWCVVFSREGSGPPGRRIVGGSIASIER